VFRLQPSIAQETGSTAKERIGIYDSRAVAIAFAGSPAFQKELDELKAQHKKAQDAGDLETASKVQRQGKAMQVKLHKQGLSTVPVDDILAHIAKFLPEIQESAGVSAIVSKWDGAGLKKHPGAERVDVTIRLVDALQPTDRQRRFAVEIQQHKPISPEEAERIND
jgi:hypothetical protein